MLVHTDATSPRQNGDRWHSDVSCDEEPPMGSVLHLHTVPDCGGDTLFSSMYAAWEALSEPMKALLAPLEASHESAHLYDHLYGRRRSGGATSGRARCIPSSASIPRPAARRSSSTPSSLGGYSASPSRKAARCSTSCARTRPIPGSSAASAGAGIPSRSGTTGASGITPYGTTTRRREAEPGSRWLGIGRITESPVDLTRRWRPIRLVDVA